jgi:hypothetical protein
LTKSPTTSPARPAPASSRRSTTWSSSSPNGRLTNCGVRAQPGHTDEGDRRVSWRSRPRLKWP